MQNFSPAPLPPSLQLKGLLNQDSPSPYLVNLRPSLCLLFLFISLCLSPFSCFLSVQWRQVPWRMPDLTISRVRVTLCTESVCLTMLLLCGCDVKSWLMFHWWFIRNPQEYFMSRTPLEYKWLTVWHMYLFTLYTRAYWYVQEKAEVVGEGKHVVTRSSAREPWGGVAVVPGSLQPAPSLSRERPHETSK